MNLRFMFQCTLFFAASTDLEWWETNLLCVCDSDGSMGIIGDTIARTRPSRPADLQGLLATLSI